jgi:hypothetical protein
MSKRIDDGFSTIISFAAAPSVKFYEKEVTPPGISGGGANDTTTMRNIAWRTMAPKKLKTLSESSVVVAWDPAAYNDVLAMVQVNQLITVTLADGSSIAFWGWLEEFTPGAAQEGQQPTATVKVIPSNMNASLVETSPVIALS